MSSEDLEEAVKDELEENREKIEREETKREIIPTDTFIERMAEATVISSLPSGLVVLTFMKPVMSIFGTKEGKLAEITGDLRPDVQVYLSPVAAKGLRDALSKHLDGHEKVSGEIK